jgi:putative transposase
LAKVPTYLIRDNDSQYGVEFARTAAGVGIKVLKTPIATPNANAICERSQESVRRECLDLLFVLGQQHLYRLIKAYVSYFNLERPHQGIDQHLPVLSKPALPGSDSAQPIRVFPVLGGLHHAYRPAA